MADRKERAVVPEVEVAVRVGSAPYRHHGEVQHSGSKAFNTTLNIIDIKQKKIQHINKREKQY